MCVNISWPHSLYYDKSFWRWEYSLTDHSASRPQWRKIFSLVSFVMLILMFIGLHATRKNSSRRCTRKQQTCLSRHGAHSPFLGLLLHNSCLFELNMYGDTLSLPENGAIASRRRQPITILPDWHVLPSVEAKSNWRSMYLQRDADDRKTGEQHKTLRRDLLAVDYFLSDLR